MQVNDKLQKVRAVSKLSTFSIFMTQEDISITIMDLTETTFYLYEL